MPNMIKTVAAASAAVLLLSSCSGIGDGASPESLKILQITPDTVFNEAFIRGDQIPGKAFTCVRGVLQAFVFFDDGDVGNFTRRVKWTSSNESVLTVSNFDEQVPGTPENRFDYGSIAPLSPGSVTVTATYLDMTATIPVTVTEAGQLVITPKDKLIAPRSFQTLSTSAVLDGKETTLTGQTVFEVNNGDPDAVKDFAVLLDDATFNGIKASAPIPVKAQLNVQGGACADKAAAIDNAVLQVVDIPERTSDPVKVGLWLEPEVGYPVTEAGGTVLAEGTSQILKLIARFRDRNGDGDADDENESQELSFQPGALGTYISSDTAVAAFVGSSLLGRGSVVFGVADTEATGTAPADGTSNLSVLFGAVASATPPVLGTTSNIVPLLVRDLLLKSIEITSSAERVAADGICTAGETTYGAVPASITGGNFICLKATGTFGPASGSGPDDFTQDITKDVVWVSSVPTVLGVANGRVLGAGLSSTAVASPTTGGTAACQGEPNCNVKITASYTTNKIDPATNKGTVISKETPIIQVVFPTEDTTP